MLTTCLRKKLVSILYCMASKLRIYFFNQELPTHLLAIKDITRLKKFLTSWAVFDILYNEDYSTVLLKHWREVLFACTVVL